jgi:hypothetical protein
MNQEDAMSEQQAGPRDLDAHVTALEQAVARRGDALRELEAAVDRLEDTVRRRSVPPVPPSNVEVARGCMNFVLVGTAAVLAVLAVLSVA